MKLSDISKDEPIKYTISRGHGIIVIEPRITSGSVIVLDTQSFRKLFNQIYEVKGIYYPVVVGGATGSFVRLTGNGAN